MNPTLLHSSNTTNKPLQRFFNTAIILVLLVIGNISEVKAQVYAYQADQLAITPAFAALPAAPAKTNLFALSGNIDSGVTNVVLPFTFQLNSTPQTSINISMNGFATFGTAPATTEVTPISSATAYAGVIAPYALDLDLVPASAVQNVSYITTGVSPNRIFKMEWNVKRSNNAGTAFNIDTNNFIFQAWLYETTNVIEFHYNTFVPSSTTISNGQVGIRGTVGDFRNLSYTASWPTLPTVMTLSSQPSLAAEATNTVRLRGNGGLGTVSIAAGANRTIRFTPVSCVSPSGVTASLVTGSTATISWTAPSTPPSGGYEYVINTVASPTGPVPVAAAGTTDNLAGLANNTTYYVYVRSICAGPSTSAWSTVMSFTTGCAPVNIPYFNYIDPFDGFVIPALPPCTSIQNNGTSPNWITQTAASGDGTFFDEHLVYKGNSQTANVWWFTNGINLVAGTTYRLSYEYGGSTDFSFLTNKMQVAYGNAPANAAMSTTLANHPNIKASPISNVVNFTASSTGVFYFGFKAYSNPNQGDLYLDTIEIVPSICNAPTGVTAGPVGSTTAFLSWTAPSPVPAAGYAYYLSTSATPPAYDQVASGTTSAGTTVVNITGLTGNTSYCFWVRGNCTGGDYSQWSLAACFTTSPQPVFTYCTPAPTSVDGQGITNVTVGSINNSTGAEPGNYGNYSSMITNVSQGATVNVSITYSTGFTYNTKIWIDWNNDSDFIDAGENVYTGMSAAPNPSTLLASFVVPGGAPLGEHRMRIGGKDFDTPVIDPCYSDIWGTFEDYTVNVVVPPPALTLNINSSIQCAGTTSPLVTITNPLSNYNTYTWSPATGVSGDAVNGYTFNPSTTITYTLTGVQTSLPFSSNTVSFTYYANALPTPITINPATPTSCQTGPAIQLTATGGVVSGLPILYEDFNGTAPSWTTANTSTGGATAAAAWTLRPNGYNPGGASGIATVISNDATQFMISNSDAQGSGTTTNVTLTSPAFSLVGYTNASLNFYHYYKVWVNGSATVQIYNPATATWDTALTWGNTGNGGTTQGAATNFAHVVYDLSAYIGQAGVQVRFVYNAQWGYVWALDNFLISGSASSSITWSPVTGLWNDAAATSPYVAGTGTNTVYALPAANQTYTASASTPMPTVCATLTTVDVTVTPLVGGTASSSHTICNGVANDLTLSGQTGTVSGWEYSTTAAFTTPVAIPASASATLTSAQIGTLSANRWFRAVITNGTCTGYSNIVAITLSSTTWTGTWSNGLPNSTKAVIFNANYSSTGNVNACSVVVNSGNVVINSGHSLIVQNSVTKNGGTLTINDDASLVQVNDAAVNAGTITYLRNTTAMIQYDYTYWSSPLSPQTLVGLSPLTAPDKYYRFDTAANQYVSVPSNSLMVPAKGYIIRAPQNFNSTPTIFNGIFDGGDVSNPNDGVPNNGVITIPIVGPGPNNFNLIGNPYPSALDADLFLTYPANDAITDATLYFWTHNTAINPLQYTGSDYAVYNLTGGVGTGTGTAGGGIGNSNVPTRYIAAGQGFFIKGTANGNATFNNSMRVGGNNANFYRVSQHNASPGSLEKNRIWLEMKNSDGSKYKQTLVGYIETATNEKDGNFDGNLVEAGNAISLYSVLGTDKLGIQGRALPFDTNDQVPIGYRSSIAGDFEINMSDFDGLFDTQNIYLEDKVLNVIHDLKSGSYAFSTTTGTFDDRFILRYTDGSLGIGNPVFDENSVVVYKNDGGIHINTANIIMESVKIFDIRGRLIFDKKGINSSETTITNLNAEEQVLLVQITSDDNRVVTKKIVY